MRQIKFRGRFWNMDGHDASECEHRDGDIIYGGYARMKLDAEDGYADYIINEFGKAYLIYPESVAQFVGHDKNGREVYEGDILIHASGEEWVAALGSYARNKPGLATYNFEKLTLKENCHEH